MSSRASALAFVVAGVALGGQAQVDPPPPVFRATAELVQFDARFLDQQGRPVTDIRREEVTVTQQGQVVTLADLRFEPRVTRGTTPSPTQRAPEPRQARPDPRQADVEPWVFLIDDLAMSPDAFARAKTGLLAILENGVLPDVEVAVLRTGELGRRTAQLSSDRGALVQAVTAMRYAANRWRGGRMSRSGATGAGTAGKDRVFLEGTLGSLNSLLVDLRALEGRKVVIVLSEAIALTAKDENHVPGGMGIEWSAEYENVAGRLRRLGRLAAESGVTVHTIDLAGVHGLEPRDRTKLDEGLHAVADELGGVYFGRSNDVGHLLGRMVAAEEGQYVLSYVPPVGTFDRRGKTRFVPIAVTVSRPGVKVRTRSGFFAP
jgi:VWFA-related protein